MRHKLIPVKKAQLAIQCFGAVGWMKGKANGLHNVQLFKQRSDWNTSNEGHHLKN